MGFIFSETRVGGPLIGTEARNSLAQTDEAVFLGIVLTQLAAVLAFVDPGLAKDANCAALRSEDGWCARKPGRHRAKEAGVSLWCLKSRRKSPRAAHLLYRVAPAERIEVIVFRNEDCDIQRQRHQEPSIASA